MSRSGGGGLSAEGVRSIVKSIVPSWVLNPWEFRQKVLGIVVSFLVAGLITAWREFLALALRTAEAVSGSFSAAFGALGLGFGSAGGAILGTVETFHATVLGAASGLGPFAFPFVVGVYAAFVLGFVWGVSWFVDAVDVPLVDAGAILRGITAPLRLAWGWLT